MLRARGLQTVLPSSADDTLRCPPLGFEGTIIRTDLTAFAAVIAVVANLSRK